MDASQFDRIDPVCGDFSAAWKAGERPLIEAYLARVVPGDRAALLAELLPLDLEYRRKAGESPALVFTVIEGPHLGRVFPFAQHDTFIVGRSGRAHFRLPKADRYLSRVHFLVEVNPPLCRLFDLGSNNGTYVNGQKVQTVDLADGDVIKAGHTRIRVTLPPERPLTELYEPPPPAAVAARRGPPRRAATGEKCPACPGERAGDEPLCPGCQREAQRQAQTVPGYLLIRELGEGGMGLVHLALSPAGGPVAVKTIRPAVAVCPAQVARFLREARILADLDHPHIVAFEDMGEADGVLYFVMEYVPGTDGRRLIAERGPLPVGAALAMFRPLLQALDYAHAKDIVHRDIKPANLLLEPAGPDHWRPKLADFGLARVYDASQLSGLTVENQVGGTFGYMPPEQITDFRHARPAGDQYAIAATLYFMLTGCCPHDLPRNINQQLAMILNDPPVPIRQRRGDISEGLSKVIHRALHPVATERYPGVRELHRALLAARSMA